MRPLATQPPRTGGLSAKKSKISSFPPRMSSDLCKGSIPPSMLTIGITNMPKSSSRDTTFPSLPLILWSIGDQESGLWPQRPLYWLFAWEGSQIPCHFRFSWQRCTVMKEWCPVVVSVGCHMASGAVSNSINEV